MILLVDTVWPVAPRQKTSNINHPFRAEQVKVNHGSLAIGTLCRAWTHHVSQGVPSNRDPYTMFTVEENTSTQCHFLSAAINRSLLLWPYSMQVTHSWRILGWGPTEMVAQGTLVLICFLYSSVFNYRCEHYQSGFLGLTSPPLSPGELCKDGKVSLSQRTAFGKAR